ncbi:MULTISPECIES: carboxylesterase family protein [unclassified Spirosoma]|uniref:carboxylesterase/lipase family protein n=1 Tax=unclassified Spirosoma TaxID=2621999 RepID=UPI00096077DF|nr:MULTISPECIES: carboxylesterase family protein [unclassified Spirosoma]MBN8821404.1 carboxylesterase/lipase family protein [Spirosoma sp.]OJW78188.1 MAG: carboxylesterase [Spirosoma sp. 48-14]
MNASRRNFLQSLGVGVAGLGVPYSSDAAGPNRPKVTKPTGDDQLLFVGDNIAVANTEYGKVRGFILRGIHQFLGIPYGADTSGKNRFMPPQKPTPWTDVRPALWWGNSAPQIMEKRYANPYASFVDHWNYDDVSEDCLKLNVWTPALDKQKRPVVVWLHGGGFTNGNGIEQDGYHGENLSRFGNVVFCSLNHRLGPLGYTDLKAVGGHAASGNVGNLDMVAALEWVKNNIANFGGDPNNVTIIGQSGGGAKVTTLMNMPSAKGLFHKAVALSGSSLAGANKEYAEKLGQKVMEEAGLKQGEIEKLQQIPWLEYIAIANRAVEKMADEAKRMGIQRGGYSPVGDGDYLSKGAFFSDPNHFSADIPLMICTTFHEMNPNRTDASLEAISLDQVKEKLKPRFGDKSGDVVDAYARNFPKARPIELWALIVSNRKNAVAAADAKASQHKAPVYVAWFGWQPPLFDGRMRAFHCDDICFWFYNTDLMLTHTGGGKRPRALSEKMAGSFINFMKTGNPNGGGLPNWKPYTTQNGETMILDDVPALANDPDREARKALA